MSLRNSDKEETCLNWSICSNLKRNNKLLVKGTIKTLTGTSSDTIKDNNKKWHLHWRHLRHTREGRGERPVRRNMWLPTNDLCGGSETDSRRRTYILVWVTPWSYSMFRVCHSRVSVSKFILSTFVTNLWDQKDRGDSTTETPHEVWHRVLRVSWTWSQKV